MAESDPFATAEQMAQRSGGAIPADHPFLVTALGAATREIRKFCRWHIAPTRTETITVPVVYGRPVWLPTQHLTDLVSVTNDGTVLDVAGIDWSADGELGYLHWVTGRRALVVEFTHGYETVPDDLVDLTLQIASRALGSPLGYVREQAGSVSVTHSQAGFNVAGGTVVLEHEKRQLMEYQLGRLP